MSMTLRDLANQIADVPVWQAAIAIVVLSGLNAYLTGLFQAWRESRRKDRG